MSSLFAFSIARLYSFRSPLSFTTLHNYIITLSVLLIRDIHSAEQGFSSVCYPHAVYLLDGSAIWLSVCIYIYILHRNRIRDSELTSLVFFFCQTYMVSPTPSTTTTASVRWTYNPWGVSASEWLIFFCYYVLFRCYYLPVLSPSLWGCILCVHRAPHHLRSFCIIIKILPCTTYHMYS